MIGSSSVDIKLSGKIFRTGTTTVNPYCKDHLANYYQGNITNINNEEFSNLLRYGYKEQNLNFYKKNRIIVDVNTTVCDLKNGVLNFYDDAISIILTENNFTYETNGIVFMQRVIDCANSILYSFEQTLKNMTTITNNPYLYRISELLNISIACNKTGDNFILPKSNIQYNISNFVITDISSTNKTYNNYCYHLNGI